MLPIWLLAAMMIMVYYWRFWEPYVLLEVLGTLGKCYVSNPVAKTLLRIMTGTTVFACLPGTHPHWTQKSFKTNSST